MFILPSAKVAKLLSEEWAGEDIKVASINAYYDKNGQFSHLLEQGYSKQDIGYHAGIRDTSEVLAVDPSLVRIKARNVLPDMDWGMSGDPRKASASIGHQMLNLKVEAALKQIQSVRNGDQVIASND